MVTGAKFKLAGLTWDPCWVRTPAGWVSKWGVWGIRDAWARIFANTSYLEIDTDILTVEVSGDLAYVVLVENVLQISQGRRLQARSMATNGFERMAGRWYMIHHHGSPVVD